ncbi:MAG: acetyltransferase [Actinomycetes bacterium]|jgi:sugar O-acyltransferase (sialic acid O-acetyltransferase NeuD family)|nr:acetyltransferase [Actinomycetes bacterium]
MNSTANTGNAANGNPLIIIGAGGHGRVVCDAARAAGFNPLFFLDRKPDAPLVAGIPVYRDLDQARSAWDNTDPFPATFDYIVAIGDNAQRADEFAQLCVAGHRSVSVIHPTATLSPDAKIGAGTYIGAGVIVNTGARIGDNAIINTAAVVEHDCRVGDHAFVAPAAVMCGTTAIGDYTLLGAHATIIPNLGVGAHALIASGAVVTTSYGDGVRLFGVPAREK